MYLGGGPGRGTPGRWGDLVPGLNDTARGDSKDQWDPRQIPETLRGVGTQGTKTSSSVRRVYRGRFTNSRVKRGVLRYVNWFLWVSPPIKLSLPFRR